MFWPAQIGCKSAIDFSDFDFEIGGLPVIGTRGGRESATRQRLRDDRRAIDLLVERDGEGIGTQRPRGGLDDQQSSFGRFAHARFTMIPVKEGHRSRRGAASGGRRMSPP